MVCLKQNYENLTELNCCGIHEELFFLIKKVPNLQVITIDTIYHVPYIKTLTKLTSLKIICANPLLQNDIRNINEPIKENNQVDEEERDILIMSLHNDFPALKKLILPKKLNVQQKRMFFHEQILIDRLELF